jgi:hypothetical protein
MVSELEKHFESTKPRTDPEAIISVAKKMAETILHLQQASDELLVNDTPPSRAESLRRSIDVTSAYLDGMFVVLDKIIPLDSGEDWAETFDKILSDGQLAELATDGTTT